MIVGGYTVHLYCDHPQADWKCGHGEYTGHNEAQCFKQARKDGWVIRLTDRTARCPRHAKLQGGEAV